MPQNQPAIYVGSSPIHGKGLFAKINIAKGSVIGYLTGKKTRRNGSHVLWLNDETGFKVSCNLKYINHSDTPNACYYDDLSVVALRDINADEEITHNYGADW